MNVLIVEDDPMVALINKRYLEQITDIKTFGPVMYENDIIKSLKSQLLNYGFELNGRIFTRKKWNRYFKGY